MTAVVLWLLASLDASFCGYRAAAGRSLLIRNGAYYRRAVVRGFLWGQAVVCVSAMALRVAVATARDPSAFRADLATMGIRMTAVYVPYALAIAVAFALRVMPSVPSEATEFSERSYSSPFRNELSTGTRPAPRPVEGL